MTEVEPQRQANHGCCADRSRLQREIRQLTEKLEYSQLRKSLLESECKRLRQELREAVFKGRSSFRAPCTPSLPTEVLRHIISLATCFDGLAFPRWDDMAETNWETSSLARAAIPLVCQRWHTVGLEFLYEHLALREASQIRKLLDVVDSFTADIRQQRMGWIKGLELAFSKEDENEPKIFAELSFLLIHLLPKGRLRKFGIECGECDGSRTRVVCLVTVEVLEKCRETLEFLHLPCIEHWDSMWNTPTPRSPGDEFLHEALSAKLPHLHTLSLKGGIWNSCSSIEPLGMQFSATLKAAHSIRTLLLNAEFGRYSDDAFFAFLEAAIHLDTVHIVAGRETTILMRDLDGFLKKTPVLRRLLITPSARFKNFALTACDEGEFVHISLEEIVIYMSTLSSYGCIRILEALMLKIQAGHFPQLQRIVVNGKTSEGCLDEYLTLPVDDFNRWANAIQRCALHGVAVLSHDGRPIHLWCFRHAIRYETSGERDATSGEDDEEWYEGSDTASIAGSEHSNDYISDDSEDSRYRYIYRADIEQVDPDLEEEPEDS